jgi:ABC-2 type transport system ATP-binding protein
METVLQMKGIAKRYGDTVAVDGLSLDVHEGEVLGLLGPNGAGKTTTIRIACGLLKPDRGTVFLHGRSVCGGRLDVRLRIGLSPQQNILWGSLTCLEQLLFTGDMVGMPRRTSRERSLALLGLLGLSDKKDKTAKTLSGGMQRRLNLALALVHDPDLVVLDEPESGLDPQSRVLVRETIRSLARRKTVIVTTHNMDEADRVADRIAIIDRGRLLVSDTPEALKRTVGDGDVLEIDFPGARDERLQKALEAVRPMAPDAVLSGPVLAVRVKGTRAADLLLSAFHALRQEGIEPGEVRIRPNTLEDVFLSLTGRRLRE